MIVEKAKYVSDKISEKYSEMRLRLRAYIGPAEQADEYQVDNIYILRGYRINHNSIGGICKSLVSCHNETVNVWSHICGVFAFFGIFIALCLLVLPHQFWYAAELSQEFHELKSSSRQRDPVTFINDKILELNV